MRMATAERRDATVVNITQTHAFSIKATGKAFKILSDGLYTDKPLAVIRELSANAWDAHKAAGRADVPFDVHLPSEIEPYFSIRDFGTGLSHDDVMHHTTTYFDSSKTNTNDAIGCLGLGMKSPFSLTDQYTITSWFQGVKRTYTAYLGGALEGWEDQPEMHGTPCIALMGTEDTNEPDGIMVSLPVESRLHKTFKDRAYEIYSRYEPQPNITGQKLEIKKHTYVMQGNGWAMRAKADTHSHELDRRLNRALIIQGTIAYPIDFSALALDHLPYDERQLLEAVCDLPLDIFVQIGECDVTASREGLSYDKTTRANVTSYLENIRKEIAETFEKRFIDCQTGWEAHKLAGELFSQMSWHLRKLLEGKIQWRGRLLNGSNIFIRLDEGDIKDSATAAGITMAGTKLDYIEGKRMRNLRIALREDHMASVDADDDTLIIWDNLSATKQLRRLNIRLKETEPKPQRVLVIRTSSVQQRDLVLDALGNPQFESLHEYPEPPVVPRAASAAANTPKIEKCFLYKGSAPRYRTDYEGQWNNTDHDVNTGGVYVDTHRHQVVRRFDTELSQMDCDAFEQFVQFLKSHGIYDGPIFAIPGSHRHLAKRPGWVNLFDMVKPKILEQFKDRQNASLVRLAEEYREVEGSEVDGIIKAMVEDGYSFKKPRKIAGQTEKVFRQVYDLKDQAFKMWALWNFCSNHFRVTPDKPATTTLGKKAKELKTKFDDAYPLIHHWSHYYRGKDRQTELKCQLDYINAMDK